jgi:type VI protein secretion system component Hcp
MSNDTGDLLMKFVMNGKPIAGGSTTELAPSSSGANPLLAGFQSGRMIEIDSLSFRCGTSGSEPGAPPKPKDPNQRRGSGDDDEPEPMNPKPGGYQSWRAGKTTKYPLDIQPVSFNRTIDIASPVLIQSCIDCTSFDSATLVKRKPAGTKTAGEVYLRMDFIGVLVIKVDWSDGDTVKETISFIARSITVSYRAQLANGSLGPVISGFWSMVPGEKQVTLA